MAEWFKAAVLKTVEPGRVPGVRIPLPPPHHVELYVAEPAWGAGLLFMNPLSSISKIVRLVIRKAWAAGSPVKMVLVEATDSIPVSAEQKICSF